MSGSPRATIPEERLRAYADAAEIMGDIRPTLATVRRIHADRVILENEGRARALEGADQMLALAVRRLCVTLARSHEEAVAKIDMLVWARQLYRSDGEGALMVTMIDASIGLETMTWSVLSSRH